MSSSFELASGIGQGCCLAPLLFNIFFGAVIETWQQVSGGRLEWRTRLDGVLRRQAQLDKCARADKLQFQELGYADDLAAVTDTLVGLQKMCGDMKKHLDLWGLEMSGDKTKAMAALSEVTGILESEPCTSPPVVHTSVFEYLGAQVQVSGECVQDIQHRLDQARKAFWRLTSIVWDVRHLRLYTKLSVHRACVLSVLLYGCETWTTDWQRRNKLEKFHMTCLRKICGVSRMQQQTDGITNDCIRGSLGVPRIMDLIHQHRLRWVGHVARIPNDRLPKRMFFAFLPEGVGEHRLPGKYGGKRYRDAVIESLRVAGVPTSGWVQWACKDDGAKWRLATRRVALWYKPFQPRRGGGMPDRGDEMQRVMQKPFSKPKKGTNEQWEMAKDVVAGSKSGCLMLEARVAHEEPFRAFLVRHARK